jgi:hypothetical protein
VDRALAEVSDLFGMAIGPADVLRVALIAGGGETGSAVRMVVSGRAMLASVWQSAARAGVERAAADRRRASGFRMG